MRAISLILLALLSALLPMAPLIHPATASWSTQPSQITNNSIVHITPGIAQDGKGNVYLFWGQNPGISYIITNTTNIANNIWPSPVPYSKTGQLDYTPSIVALKNGTIILFLSRSSPLGWSIYLTRYNNGQWSLETLLTTSAPGSQGPS